MTSIGQFEREALYCPLPKFVSRAPATGTNFASGAPVRAAAWLPSRASGVGPFLQCSGGPFP